MNSSTRTTTNRDALRTLIESLGEPSRLEPLLLEFYERMGRDPMIGFFFAGKDLVRISAKQAQFLRMAAGLAPEYTGKGPATAHTDLAPILPGHFDRRIRMLEEFLAEKGLNPAQIRIWTEFEESFRAVVVRRTPPS